MDLQQEILKTCFSRFDGAFASGKKANNKLDLENIYDHPDIFEEVVVRLGQTVLEHNPQFVAGVPNGATKLADEVAKRCDLYSVHLKKTDEEKIEFDNEQLDGEMTCEPLSRGVLIEDVFNRFTSTNRALEIPELSKRVVAVEAVWDRGHRQRRREPQIPYRALIDRPIRPKLWRYSRLWEYADGE